MIAGGRSVKKYERVTAVITSLGGVWVMYYAWHTLKLGSIHVPDAGFLPFLCGVGLAILGIAWMLALQWSTAKETPSEKTLWYKSILALLLMIVYGWAMETVGYITSTLIFMVAWQQIIEREKWLKTMIISVLGTLAMYALFVHLLKVPIPPEFFLG
jgi:putative tricarboxylic transport membrane protein